MRVQRVAVIFLALLMVAGSPSLMPTITAEADEESSKPNEESVETTRLIEAELPNWSFWKQADRQKALVLEPKSLLRWTNPGSGRVYGDLYVWTAAGRPEVAMTLFKTWEPAMGFHAEIHSLSLVPLEAKRDAKVVWQPPKAGVTLMNVPDAAVPAETPGRRLAQMRSLANEFSAVLTDYRRNDTGERQALRLLTQPIYRYLSDDPELIDGAMFAFVLGTDPEIFLLLEARRLQDANQWKYGLARMNDESLMVMHKEQEVWRLQRAKSRDIIRDPYVLMKVPEAPR